MLRDLFVKNVLPKLVSGEFNHVVDRVIPWKRACEAHTLLENNKTSEMVAFAVTSKAKSTYIFLFVFHVEVTSQDRKSTRLNSSHQ